MYPTFFDKDQMQVYRKVYSKLKLNVREILLQNEPYSKLKKWFYECELLCGDKPRFANIEEYENHFGKHIVFTCNNPNQDKIKSCRKLTKKDTKNYSRIHRVLICDPAQILSEYSLLEQSHIFGVSPHQGFICENKIT